MADEFYTNGLKFSCKQCSHCCRHEPGYVYLSETDLNNILEYMGMKKDTFVEKYCKWVPYYDGSEVLCLQEKANYDCIFWDQGCKIYKARPVQCMTYPFWTFLLENRDCWNSEAKSCPGINNGENHPLIEIKEKMLLYRENQPIRRK